MPDCPAYNVVKQSHNVDPFREHPLDNVGCDRDEVSKNYHNLGNKYIRELRHLIDERTAALSEIQRFVRLPDWLVYVFINLFYFHIMVIYFW